MCIECISTELTDKPFFVPVHSSMSHNSTALAMFKVTEFTLEPARAQLQSDIFGICFLFFSLCLLGAIMAFDQNTTGDVGPPVQGVNIRSVGYFACLVFQICMF